MDNMRRSLGIALTTNKSEMLLGNSSPLRRRSSFGISLQKAPSTLSENDDEAERKARRLEQEQMETPSSTSSDRRRSLGLSKVAQMPALQISEKITQCIKLNAENKINVKNAFSLEIIDFMTYLIKKKDKEMSNFQVASTSLDVSAKIYGFRVDSVHTDILKMIGGPDKQDKNDGDINPINENNVQEGGENADDQGVQKKKKKRSKKNILSTVEALRGNVEVVNPITLMMGDEDSQTTDLLFQAILPYHENGQIHLNSYNDVIFDKIVEDEPLKSKEIEFQKITINAELDICPSFNDFKFLGWSADNEPIDVPSPQNDSRYQFDVDASLPADDVPDSHTNHFDVDDDYHEEVNRFGEGPHRTENIVELSHVIASSAHKKNFEYSYLQENLASQIQWVGPLHWKVRPQRTFAGSRIMAPVASSEARKKKEITIEQKDEEKRNTVAEKFLPGEKVRLQVKTAKVGWSEDKITYQKDEHYESKNCCTFYFRSKLHFNFLKENLNTTHLSEEVDNYNYSNDHDVSNYCPNLQNDDYQNGEDIDNGGGGSGFNSDCETGIGTQGILAGENLVAAPKLASKIFIPYSIRAKKIDMRHLKKSIWRCLTKSVSDKENIDIREAVEQEMSERIKGSKSFCEVYKELPKLLSKQNSDALSLPIAFVSLLHLANEKCLEVKLADNLSDLIVKQS